MPKLKYSFISSLNVQLIHKDAQNFSNMINFTTNLADNVSSKVRKLDIAKSRVVNCIKRVTDILDLKACTDGVREALAEEDYEAVRVFCFSKHFTSISRNLFFI